MPNIVHLENINKIYGDKVKTQVLFDIQLSIQEASFTSLIGASGSGKSTLLNIIGTLDRPSSGKIFIDQKQTNTMTNNELARLRNHKIGFIFQFHYLLNEFSVRENVLIPYWISHSVRDKSAIQRADELLDMVGLTHVKHNKANQISGGQQQRTAIARSLMNQPKLILADEPTGNLDSESTENIYSLLRKINQSFGTSFLIVTHDLRIAEKADRMIEIRDGKIYQDIML